MSKSEDSSEDGDIPRDDVIDEINTKKKRNLFINFDKQSNVSLSNNDMCSLIKRRSHSSSSNIFKDWVFMSHWSNTSAEIGNQNTLHSLQHLPSNDRKSNAFLMAVNMQSMILGTSVLGLPYCVKIAGVWALFAIVLVGLASAFTSVLLGDCQYQVSLSEPGKTKRIHISFVDMSTRCMGKYGTFIIKGLVYLSLLRNVIVLVLLTDLTENVLKEFAITEIANKDYITLGWMLASIPLLMIDKVSYLAWVSFVGLKLYLFALLTILVICCINHDRWDFRTISWDANIEGIGIALGIIINSVSVHMNLPSLEGSLKNPKQYKVVSHITFFFNIVTKITFASFGFLTYTQATREEIIGNVTSFLPLPTILQIAMAFFTFFTIPMSSFVAFELLDNSVKKHFHVLEKKTWIILSRLVCMAFVLLIALLVPHFGLVVSLIGSIRGTSISLVLPPLFYIMLKTHQVETYKLILSWLVLILGLCAGLLGLYSSVKVLIAGKVDQL